MKKQLCIILGVITVVLSAGSSFGSTILPNDDVFVYSDNATFTNIYDGYVQSPPSQIAFGLGAANGTSSGARRSFIEFTFGTEAVSSAIFKVYNYWGPNMGGGGNNTVSGSLRLRITSVGSPVQITEPAGGGLVTDGSWLVPSDSSGWSTISTITINPGGTGDPVGWYSFDITSFYNARLGQTTCLLLRGSFTGYDFPLLEDREGTAYLNGSQNTLANSGPQIEITVVPEPSSLVLLAMGGLVVWLRRR
jgi:hypothetical protein